MLNADLPLKPSPAKFWQSFIALSIAVSVAAFYQTMQQILKLNVILWRSKWIVLPVVFALNIIAGIWALRQLSGGQNPRWVQKLEFNAGNIFVRLAGVLLFLAGFCAVWLARLFVFHKVLPQLTPVIWVFLWAGILQALGLKLISGRKWHVLFVSAVLAQGAVFQIYSQFAYLTDYPFSIGYSEASRHYYASLFFAKPLYGIKTALPFLHPSRYMLLSLPFLADGLPLWLHRAWQAILWIGLTAASSMLLARRLGMKGWELFIFSTWAFLYFFQGAVYYHLQVCVILILTGVSTRRPARSLLFVIAASIWAGVSRVNWFPVPAMLAIAFYLLETPIDKKGWRYWVTPFVWGICGLAAAVVSQFVYINISGNADASSFGSSFTSDLLWNRLLPNATYPLGVLTGIALVSAPLLLALFQMARGNFSRLHPLRWAALAAMLLALFLGGLIVSVKIGGGGDLHNMDAFLVLLLLVAASFFSGQAAGEEGSNPVWGPISSPVVAAVLLVPLGFAIPKIGFLPRFDHSAARQDVQIIQEAASQAVAGGGEVLFMTERQLLTFKIINGVPLVPEYEQIELMEMAMSGNRDYLEQFYSDLESGRFAIIIAEKQSLVEQGREDAFGEENNAWVRYVGAPLSCAYEPVESLASANLQIFVPAANPSCLSPFPK
jgi:hypothetical protein